jgi:hypothetical protein
VRGLGAISNATTYQHPLPSCRLDNGLHSILGRFKVVLGWFVNDYSSHSFTGRNNSHPQSQGGHSWVQRELVPMMQRDNFTSELGGIMEVAMLGFDLDSI